MPIKPKKIVFVEDRELHFISEGNNGVVVAWNLRCKSHDRRNHPPYIDFVSVLYYKDKYWEMDDSFIDAGFYIKEAEKLVEDLKAAIEYMKSLDQVTHE